MPSGARFAYFENRKMQVCYFIGSCPDAASSSGGGSVWGKHWTFGPGCGAHWNEVSKEAGRSGDCPSSGSSVEAPVRVVVGFRLSWSPPWGGSPSASSTPVNVEVVSENLAHPAVSRPANSGLAPPRVASRSRAVTADSFCVKRSNCSKSLRSSGASKSSGGCWRA